MKWKDGKRHGVATKIHPDGAKYIVEFNYYLDDDEYIEDYFLN